MPSVSITSLPQPAIPSRAHASADPRQPGDAPASSPSSTTDGDAPAALTVFAAASLTEAFDELAARFEQEHPGVEVTLNYGGSGTLAQQVLEGAPADVFASAALQPMQAVADEGLADDAVVFATNTLELAVPAGNPAAVAGLDDLARPELRIALCDASVPCGAASVALLDQEGVVAAADTLESDVKAVLTKVALGEVDAALVYRTEVLAAGDAVEGIEVPGAASVVNRSPIAVMADAASPDEAAEFVAFVTGAEARAALDAAGFGTP
jgi:molybdate transport system substrate-binding protein